MTTPIKLHWASSKPNFGDWLSPAVCEYIARRPVTHSSINNCDLVAVGSLLQRAKEHFWNRRIHVWGTGVIEARPPAKSRHYYHAVRGPLTASTLSNHSVSQFGDPGLLVDQLIAAGSGKPYRLGVVPHYKEQQEASIQNLHKAIPGSILIDVFEPPEQVIKKITQCEFVVSSSLHGLIVADAFSIPNAWLQVSEQIRGAGWKFKDYYAAFGIEGPMPLLLSEKTPTLESIIDHIGDYQRPGLDAIKEGLLKSFPFQPGIEV